MAAPDVGTGAILTFQSGLAAFIESLDIDGYEVPIIDVPTMADIDVVRRLFGRLRTPPTLQVALLLDQDEDMDAVLAADPETVTIILPTPTGYGGGAEWSFTGKATAWTASIPVEDAMRGTLTIAATTKITFTPSYASP